MQSLKTAGTPVFRSRGFCLMIAACAIVILAGCHSMPKLTPQQAEGEHLYDVRCAHCHEENDLALKKVPPDLHGLFGKNTLPSGSPATDSEVERVVLAGKGMMPSFAGRFTQEQMSDLLAYLHTGIQDQSRK
jgi:mono/diheme cytochrome c family protein